MKQKILAKCNNTQNNKSNTRIWVKLMDGDSIMVYLSWVLIKDINTGNE